MIDTPNRWNHGEEDPLFSGDDKATQADIMTSSVDDPHDMCEAVCAGSSRAKNMGTGIRKRRATSSASPAPTRATNRNGLCPACRPS
jgi:hypothetical protein